MEAIYISNLDIHNYLTMLKNNVEKLMKIKKLILYFNNLTNVISLKYNIIKNISFIRNVLPDIRYVGDINWKKSDTYNVKISEENNKFLKIKKNLRKK